MNQAIKSNPKNKLISLKKRYNQGPKQSAMDTGNQSQLIQGVNRGKLDRHKILRSPMPEKHQARMNSQMLDSEGEMKEI